MSKGDLIGLRAELQRQLDDLAAMTRETRSRVEALEATQAKFGRLLDRIDEAVDALERPGQIKQRTRLGA